MISFNNLSLPIFNDFSHQINLQNAPETPPEFVHHRQELLQKIRSLLLEKNIINQFYDLNEKSHFPIPALQEIENFEPFDQFLNQEVTYHYPVNPEILDQTFWDLIKNCSKLHQNFQPLIDFIQQETGFELNAKIIKEITYSLFKKVKKDEPAFMDIIELIKNETSHAISSAMLEKIRHLLIHNRHDSSKELKTILAFLHDQENQIYHSQHSFKQLLKKFQNLHENDLDLELLAGWFLHIVTNHHEAFNQLFQTFLKANDIYIDEFIAPKSYRYRPEMDLRVYFQKEWHELLEINDQLFETFISFFSVNSQYDHYYYRTLFRYFTPKASPGFPNTVLGNAEHKLDLLIAKDPSPPLFATDRVTFKLKSKDLIQPNSNIPILKINFKNLKFHFEKITHFYQCLINLLFGIDSVNNPSQVNNKVIPRLISRHALGFRFPKNELSILLKKNITEEQLLELFEDYHIHHHEGDQELLMGFLINAFLLIGNKGKGFDLNTIWNSIKKFINVETIKHPIFKNVYNFFDQGIETTVLKKMLQLEALFQNHCQVSFENENNQTLIKLNLTSQISVFIPHPSLSEMTNLIKEFSSNTYFKDIFNSDKYLQNPLFFEKTWILHENEFFAILKKEFQEGKLSNPFLQIFYRKICQSFPPGPFNSFAKKLDEISENSRQVFLSHFLAYSDTLPWVYPMILQLSKEQIKNGFNVYINALKKISFAQTIKFAEDLSKANLVEREQIEQILKIPYKHNIEDRLTLFSFIENLCKNYLKSIKGPSFFFNEWQNILKDYLQFDLKNALNLCMLAYEQGELSKDRVKTLFEDCLKHNEFSSVISNYLLTINKKIDLFESLLTKFKTNSESFRQFCQKNWQLACNFTEECVLNNTLAPHLLTMFLSNIPKGLPEENLLKIYCILDKVTDQESFQQPNYFTPHFQLFNDHRFIHSPNPINFLRKTLAKKMISKKQTDLLIRSILNEYAKIQKTIDLPSIKWIILEKINVDAALLLRTYIDQAADFADVQEAHAIIESALLLPAFFSEKLNTYLCQKLKSLIGNDQLFLDEFLHVKVLLSPIQYGQFLFLLLKTTLLRNDSHLFYNLIENVYLDKQLSSINFSEINLREAFKIHLSRENLSTFVSIISKPYLSFVYDRSQPEYFELFNHFLLTPSDFGHFLEYFDQQNQKKDWKLFTHLLVKKISDSRESCSTWQQTITKVFEQLIHHQDEKNLVFFTVEISPKFINLDFLTHLFIKSIQEKNFLSLKDKLTLTAIFLEKTPLDLKIYEKLIMEALDYSVEEKVCIKHLKNYTNCCLKNDIPFNQNLFHKFLKFSLTATYLHDKIALITKILDTYFDNYSKCSLEQKDEDFLVINKILDDNKSKFPKVELFTFAYAVKYFLHINIFEKNENFERLIDLLTFVLNHVPISKNWISIFELALHKICIIFYRNCQEHSPQLNLKKIIALYDLLIKKLNNELFILWICTLEKSRLGDTHFIYIGQKVIQKVIKLLQETPHLELYKKAIYILDELCIHNQMDTENGYLLDSLYSTQLNELMLLRTKYSQNDRIDFFSLVKNLLDIKNSNLSNPLKTLVLINNYLTTEQFLAINTNLIDFITNRNPTNNPLSNALQFYFNKLLKENHMEAIKEWFTSDSLIRDYPELFLKLALQLHSQYPHEFTWDFLLPIYQKHYYRVTSPKEKIEIDQFIYRYPLSQQIAQNYYLLEFFLENVLQIAVEMTINSFADNVQSDLYEQKLRNQSDVDAFITKDVLRQILNFNTELFERKEIYYSIPTSDFNFMILQTCYQKIRNFFFANTLDLVDIKDLFHNSSSTYESFTKSLQLLKNSIMIWVRFQTKLGPIFFESVSSQLNKLLELKPTNDLIVNDQILVSMCVYMSILYRPFDPRVSLYEKLLKVLPTYQSSCHHYSFYLDFINNIGKDLNNDKVFSNTNNTD